MRVGEQSHSNADIRAESMFCESDSTGDSDKENHPSPSPDTTGKHLMYWIYLLFSNLIIKTVVIQNKLYSSARVYRRVFFDYY